MKMYLNEGNSLTVDEKVFTIGDRIKVNAEDELYEGFEGIITAMFDSEDEDVPSVDILVDLDVPKKKIKVLEDRFTRANGVKTSIKEIEVTDVIMSPAMIDVIKHNT